MRCVLIFLLVTTAHAAEWPDLRTAPKSEAGVNDAALIVAVENYTHVGNVAGAEANARAWRTWLRARGTTQVKVLLDAEVEHGYDRDGRPTGVLARLDEMRERVKPGGTLWFVFIGHGAPNGDPDHPEGLLLASDVRGTPESIRSKGIPVDRDLLPRLKPRARGARSVGVLDACFSGKNTAGRELVPNLQPVFMVKSAAVPSGVTLLTAAARNQYAGPLPGGGRPAFSYLALGALRGWGDLDRDGAVSGAEARQFIEDALFELLRGRKQTPSGRGDLTAPLAKGREAGPKLDAFGPRPPGPVVPNPLDQRLAELRAAEDAAAAVDTSGMSDYEREMAKLAAARATRVRMEQEAENARLAKERAREEAIEREKQARARALAAHTVEVDRRWKAAQGLGASPAKGITAVDAFTAHYSTHPMGNPRAAEAAAFKARLEGEIESAAQAAHEAEVGRVWAMTKRAAKGGGPEGRKAVELFLKRYAAHARGNPKGSEAQDLLVRLGGGRGADLRWVRLRKGCFRMGSKKGESREKPVRRVCVKRFDLSKTEVTVGQYAACVKAGKCSAPDTGEYCNWEKAGHEDHPINCVDWGQAAAFARWAGGRLPSEAEWAYAARSGGKKWRYPWGNQKATCARAVMNDGGGYGCGKGRTWPVCSKPAGNTKQGLCDMAGNVWEWVADWYGPYGEAPTNGSARTNAAQLRVLRGGGWRDSARYLRAAIRRWNSPGSRNNFLGFRVARSAP